MSPFELQEPHSLREALEYLDQDDPAVRPLAGGTALMLMMKAGVFRPTRLVSLRRLPREYSQIEASGNEIRIGALATLSTLERSAVVRRELPVVAQTLVTLSNVRVRNVATLGGHLAHADPHMDLPPVLIALGARLTTATLAGERTIPAEELFKGYYETSLDSAELITQVRIPIQPNRRGVYLKCTARSADDWPALGIAVVIDPDGQRVGDARVVVSAATEKPTRLNEVEALLRGNTIDAALLKRAGNAAAEEANVISGVRGSAGYKRQLLRVYVARAVAQALS
ncbi:MAG TPA: xanthine dehydrogenase family protein subunit M [Burkholderiales bacterium]|nr:xanthine dehydrogenase family protein subunit M [Burkholderiales bacterium]